MFYKMEERGESIHAELNAIQRIIWCTREASNRLWAYIERYELRNSLDISIVEPIKRKCGGEHTGSPGLKGEQQKKQGQLKL